MKPLSSPPTVVAITGASGCILGFRLVHALLQLEQPVELIISGHSFQVIFEEMNLQVPKGADQAQVILDYTGLNRPPYNTLLQCYDNKQFGAAPASGTHLTRGMVVIPCSMTTLGKIATGVTDNLVARAADVTLKEKRKLLLVPRESPLNRIHLENLLKLDAMGAVVIPPVLSFYKAAFNSIDGQINYTLGKVLDHLGLTQHELSPRWGNEAV